MSKKEELVKFLRHIGEDFCEDETVEIFAECKGQSDDEGLCPDHQDCGICRFEYMKQQGWLSEEANQ